LSEAHALANRAKAQSRAVWACRIKSATPKHVDRAHDGHAGAYDCGGVFWSELQASRAEQKGQATPGGRFREAIERVVEHIRHALGAVSKPT